MEAHHGTSCLMGRVLGVPSPLSEDPAEEGFGMQLRDLQRVEHNFDRNRGSH